MEDTLCRPVGKSIYWYLYIWHSLEDSDALQAWPIPLMVICWLAPESPWWLVRNDRIEDAERSIARLSSIKTQQQIRAQVAMILHTEKTEAEITRGASYMDCFKGVNLRRTEIVCVVFCGQILSGSSFSYSPTYFFTSAGMATTKAFDLGLGATAMAFVGVIA